jgi:hypothetical protein
LPLNDDVPADLASLALACLARLPEARPTSRELERALAARLARGGAEPGARSAAPVRARVDVGALPDGLGRRLARARRELMKVTREATALAEVEAVLAVAPDLDAALALHALAAVRVWNRAGVGAPGDVAAASDRALTAVSEAVARAPHVADTHLADALIADYSGDVAYAARALRRGLAHDPLHAWSHEVLGRIEEEAGLDGAPRILLAEELDAGHVVGLVTLARSHFFRGEATEAAALLARFAAVRASGLEAATLRARAALWFRDARLAESAIDLLDKHGAGAPAVVRSIADVARRRCAPDECVASLVADAARGGSPKRKAFQHQLAAEVLAAIDPQRALEHVVSAVRLPLSDLQWLDRCPALAPLRGLPAFRTARASVQQRVDLAFGAVASAPPGEVVAEDTEVMHTLPSAARRGGDHAEEEGRARDGLLRTKLDR